MVCLGRWSEFMSHLPYFTGTNTAVLPLYMTEIPPVHLRGSVGVSHQLGITGAILLSQILGLNYVCPPKEHHALSIMFAKYCWLE